MIPRRRVLVAIAAGAFAGLIPFAAFAQQKPARVYRIGILTAGPRSQRRLSDSLRASLREMNHHA